MKLLDVSKLVPRVVVPLTSEQHENTVAEVVLRAKQHGGVTPSQGMLDSYCRRRVENTADHDWLKANLPVGTLFDHLGAACMVIGHTLQDVGMSREWAAKLDMESASGVAMVIRTVPELRAMIEPGFVVEVRWPK